MNNRTKDALDDRGCCPWCGDDQETWAAAADDEECWIAYGETEVYDMDYRCSTCDQIYRVYIVRRGDEWTEARITR